MQPDGTVSGENGLVQIFEGMVASSTATSPLHDDGVIGVGSGDVRHLAYAVNRTRFERNLLSASGIETIDNLDGLFSGGDTRGDTKTFNRKASSSLARAGTGRQTDKD